MGDKSFQEILEEKIAAKDQQRQASRTESLSTIAGTQFWQIQKPKPIITSNYQQPAPIRQKTEWTAEQAKHIQALIELGADIYIDSTYADIKKAYRDLLIKYHPDHQTGADELSLRRHARALQRVIQTFRSFEGSRSVKAA